MPYFLLGSINGRLEPRNHTLIAYRPRFRKTFKQEQKPSSPNRLVVFHLLEHKLESTRLVGCQPGQKRLETFRKGKPDKNRFQITGSPDRCTFQTPFVATLCRVGLVPPTRFSHGARRTETHVYSVLCWEPQTWVLLGMCINSNPTVPQYTCIQSFAPTSDCKAVYPLAQAHDLPQRSLPTIVPTLLHTLEILNFSTFSQPPKFLEWVIKEQSYKEKPAKVA